MQSTVQAFLKQCKPSFENPYGEALVSRLYWLWFLRMDPPKQQPSTVPIGTTYTGGVFGDSILNNMPSI